MSRRTPGNLEIPKIYDKLGDTVASHMCAGGWGAQDELRRRRLRKLGPLDPRRKNPKLVFESQVSPRIQAPAPELNLTRTATGEVLAPGSRHRAHL